MDRKNKFSGIYAITNAANGKVYVGSAKCIASRWQTHLKQMRAGDHHSLPLRRAVTKYGVESFLFSVLEECKVEELIVREQHYIDNMNPEYNVCRVAGSCLGIKHTEEQKKANSEAGKILRSTVEWKEAQSARIKRVFEDPVFRAEMAEKIRERMRDTPKEVLRAKFTEDVRKKISDNQFRVAPKYEVRGELLRLSEITTRYGVSRSAFGARLKNGWDIERAATTPPDKKHTSLGERKYELDGVKMNLAELSRACGWTAATLLRRLEAGLGVEEAALMTKEQAELRRRELIKKGMANVSH